MTMGVFLLQSGHGIHVSSRVIMPDFNYFKWVFHSLLRAKIIGQALVPFTVEVVQLCDYPIRHTSPPYPMAPTYQCMLTLRACFEFRFIYNA